MQGVILKKGKERLIAQRHHWIFSGAIESYPPSYVEGGILPILDHEKQLLGYGYFNQQSSISGRILSFGTSDPLKEMRKRIEEAIELRKMLFAREETNSYRLINSEGDGLPGLIADLYGDTLVIQISTLGMEKLKPRLINDFSSLLPLRAIYEKSLTPSRDEEGLLSFEGLLYGNESTELEILERGSKFIISYKEGQKTGFFLDQREMRSVVANYAKGRSVLNCFCYTGGFTVAALKGGASTVDSVDISKDALALAKRNVLLNGFSLHDQHFLCEDVPSFLRKAKTLSESMVILDPPAFVKKRKDLIQGCRAYKEINRQAMQKMPKHSLLLTCSCSYFVDETLFQQVIFQAAQEANRSVRILEKHHLAADHPINLFHKEGSYLKSFLLYIE